MPHGRTGVLLLQLGTPDAPTPSALRRYLRQFLSDRRVIDLNRALWWLVLNLSVLPRRPRKSAALYRRIWTEEGSPLLVISRRQAAALEAALTSRLAERVPVAVAMRYGNPSTEHAVRELLDKGVDRIIALPMYPQYASATTGSSVEELFAVLGRLRVVPPVRVVPPYYDDPAYINALRSVTERALDGAAFTPDRIVISFHGLPARYVAEGDPYRAHCESTGRELARAMAWPDDRVRVVFQSQFGREEWLQPYAEETIRSLPAEGVRTMAALCPGFTADCLETIEEMGMTNREFFLAAGGTDYVMAPCLNDDPAWIDGMAALIEREAAGWTCPATAAAAGH